MGLAVVLFVANLAAQPQFVSAAALPATLAILAPFAIVAMASVPSVVSGGLDLAVGPVLSVTNVMFVAVLLPSGLGSPTVAIPILLVVGALVGAASGIATAYLRLPAIITGLCALFMVAGAGQLILLTPRQAPANWTDTLGGSVGPVPVAVLTMAVPVLIWTLLRRTPFVNAMFSVGGHAPTAFAAGLDVRAVRVIAYALGGVFAAIGGIALTAVIRSGDSSVALQYTLIAIAAMSLGGTPIGGGRGGLIGVLFGAVCIFLMQNLISALGIAATWMNVVYGCVLVAVVVVSSRLAPRPNGGLAS
ncbi:ABC transporter permease [Pseudonocardia kujensis]|uniref:ABC transporter permease n=1 Tax=Pseudonocardia kujensis TaxID=1128675 RepID=UPI001E64B6DC|nr:ABC transporter permease [Pseudonocardia kujensis]MCE0766886.1 ABC transporter permease [Pseudonocardia kujensis]